MNHVKTLYEIKNQINRDKVMPLFISNNHIYFELKNQRERMSIMTL